MRQVRLDALIAGGGKPVQCGWLVEKFDGMVSLSPNLRDLSRPPGRLHLPGDRGPYGPLAWQDQRSHRAWAIGDHGGSDGRGAVVALGTRCAV